MNVTFALVCVSGALMGCGAVNPRQIDLSHFYVYQVVGKGGFGKVNAIQKKGTKVLMALKRMSKEIIIKNPKNIARVWTERNLMTKFDSPFLVGLNYAFQSKTELFFVMPFLSGMSALRHVHCVWALQEGTCGIT
jgi:serine/threonine protein kinase